MSKVAESMYHRLFPDSSMEKNILDTCVFKYLPSKDNLDIPRLTWSDSHREGPGFNPGPVHVDFEAYKLAVGQAYLRASNFYPVCYNFHKCFIIIPSSLTSTICNLRNTQHGK